MLAVLVSLDRTCHPKDAVSVKRPVWYGLQQLVSNRQLAIIDLKRLREMEAGLRGAFIPNDRTLLLTRQRAC